jgi:hypothetical protein
MIEKLPLPKFGVSGVLGVCGILGLISTLRIFGVSDI